MGSQRENSYRKTGEIGIISGSERLDPNQFTEPDLDDLKDIEKYFDTQLNSPEFRKEMEDKIAQWNQIIAPQHLSDFNFYVVGQSHIDMAWLWRYEQTRQKGITTLKKVVAHASKFPQQFKFAVSSPQLLSWIKEDSPELFEDIRDLVKKSVIEPVGGSWVEPDCMLPSGEAMVRQRLYGMMFYRQEFGILPEVEWFLDSFGYNRGLPQILAKSGAKYFWTTKLTWNKQNKFPFVYFKWRSPDGTQLLTANFGQNRELFDQWRDYPIGHYVLKEEGKKHWRYAEDLALLSQLINRDEIIKSVGLFWGAGDGGHGPTHYEVAMLQVLREIAKKRGIKWDWSTVREFFLEVKKYDSKLATWEDELYLETHRGTFTTHSEVKRHNRRLENKILDIERLATLNALKFPDYPFPYELFDKCWKRLLLNQFHDVLPGSCIPEVLDDAFLLFQQIDEDLDKIVSQVVKNSPLQIPPEFSSENILLFFNPLNWKRKSRVFIPKSLISHIPIGSDKDNDEILPYAKIYYYHNGELNSSICQPVKAEFKDNMKNNPAGWWTIIEIEPHGWLVGEVRFEQIQSPPLFVTLRKNPRMTNGKVNLEFDSHSGSLITLKGQKINNGENLVYGKRNLLLEGYHDKGSSEYPAWDLQREYWKYPRNFDQTKDLEITIINQGPIFSTLQFKRTLENTPVIQKVSLFHGDPLIYCSWEADWQLPDTLLKLGLHTTTQATTVTADQMYCASHSSTLPESPADKARFEKVMHKFVDLSTPDNTWGIALINEGKYAYDVSAGRIRISMHRSPKFPRPSAESWVKFERTQRKREGKGKPPKYTGIGPTSCRYGILPHTGGCLINRKNAPASFVAKTAEEFNHPIIVSAYPKSKEDSDNMQKVSEIPNCSFHVELPTGVRLTVVKKEQWNQDGCYILRFAEFCGFNLENVQITFPEVFSRLIKEIWETDLLERPISSSNTAKISSNCSLIVSFSPFEVKTFKIVLKNPKE